MKKILLISIAMLLLTTRPALAAVVYTFDGTSLDGWTVSPSASFTLSNPGAGGNTGGSNDGYARLGDAGSGGLAGFAVAPPLGPLDGYASISWDALLPDNWNFFSATRLVTLVISNNSTDYSYMLDIAAGGGLDILDLGTAGVWQHWEAPLVDSPAWERTRGSDSLATVLADNSAQIAFILEVTTRAGTMLDPTIEAGLDNVMLNPIPVPAAVWLFGSGLLGLVGVARRRQN